MGWVILVIKVRLVLRWKGETEKRTRELYIGNTAIHTTTDRVMTLEFYKLATR